MTSRNYCRPDQRVFRLVRREGCTYWTGPHDPQDFGPHAPWMDAQPGEEVRRLSIADAFDAAPQKEVTP